MNLDPTQYNRLPSPCVAIDGGTTNTRARVIVDGRIVASASRAVGARDSVLKTSENALARATREVILESLARAALDGAGVIVASGMMGSDAGLASIPHVYAPAGIDELAAGVVSVQLPEVHELPIVFIPGVRTPPGEGPLGWLDADVMRGEECETIGALAALGGNAGQGSSGRETLAFLWPGSHTKLVEVDSGGRITRSLTTIAGELTAAVAKHTLIAASLPEAWPEELDQDALAMGVLAAERLGLGRAGFLVRIAAALDRLGPDERLGFWLGASVAADVDCLLRGGVLKSNGKVWIGGRSSLKTIYHHILCTKIGDKAKALADDVAEESAAAGALAVASRFFQRTTAG